ncbi:MAG: hypothetical protein JSS98_12520 [Bacteroidetes bacterium]|nr:hypothetical protein [Bacteroidota bacterium]
MIKGAKRFLLCVVLFFFQIVVYCQSDLIDSVVYAHQVDFKDVVHRIIHVKHLKPKEERKNFQLSIYPAVGYSSNTSFVVLGGANALFTLKGATKQSTASTSLTLSLYDQILFPFQSSLWTKNDKFNIILDARYISYPTTNFGLRGRSKLDSGYSINFQWIKIHSSVLGKIGENFYGGVGLYFDHFWNIKEQGIPVGRYPAALQTAFEHYVKRKIPNSVETSFGPAIKALYDSRDNPLNAYKGAYLSASFQSSFKRWGSDTGWSSLIVDGRKFFSFSKKRQSVLALWAYYWRTFGDASFLQLPSTGWDDSWNTGRGYGQGRFRGTEMQYFEAEYRFQISKNGLLGGVVFSNVQNYPKELFTSFSEFRGRRDTGITKIGAGLGVRLKFNKYSKTNIALDVGFGQNLPHPWIAVNLGEVF